MGLKNLLIQKKAVILKRWCDMILETYPPDAAEFFKQEGSRFANPVGYTILREIESLYGELLEGVDADKISPFLDRIIRIRAIQDFSPSEAVAFVYFLKKVIREELAGEIHERRFYEDLLKFDSRIDELALLAFDTYMQCREKIYEIRVDEVRNRVFSLLKRANLICDVSEEASELDTGSHDRRDACPTMGGDFI
ncbi:MAG: RsbRD N-terminal domain-containing protein [Syntrophales bacterium]|nr:RsbRD N-terminal domain-containing protein [Syntrophales bacterium]